MESRHHLYARGHPSLPRAPSAGRNPGREQRPPPAPRGAGAADGAWPRQPTTLSRQQRPRITGHTLATSVATAAGRSVAECETRDALSGSQPLVLDRVALRAEEGRARAQGRKGHRRRLGRDLGHRCVGNRGRGVGNEQRCQDDQRRQGGELHGRRRTRRSDMSFIDKHLQQALVSGRP